MWIGTLVGRSACLILWLKSIALSTCNRLFRCASVDLSELSVALMLLCCGVVISAGCLGLFIVGGRAKLNLLLLSPLTCVSCRLSVPRWADLVRR